VSRRAQASILFLATLNPKPKRPIHGLQFCAALVLTPEGRRSDNPAPIAVEGVFQAADDHSAVGTRQPEVQKA